MSHEARRQLFIGPLIVYVAWPRFPATLYSTLPFCFQGPLFSSACVRPATAWVSVAAVHAILPLTSSTLTSFPTPAGLRGPPRPETIPPLPRRRRRKPRRSSSGERRRRRKSCVVVVIRRRRRVRRIARVRRSRRGEAGGGAGRRRGARGDRSRVWSCAGARRLTLLPASLGCFFHGSFCCA